MPQFLELHTCTAVIVITMLQLCLSTEVISQTEPLPECLTQPSLVETCHPPQPPADCPIELYLEKYANWPHDIIYCLVWKAYPKTSSDVVAIANWAYKIGYKLRPSGHEHSWSPITLSDPAKTNGPTNSWPYSCPPEPPKVILLSTKYLNKMQVIRNETGRGSFWTEPGLTLLEICTELEYHNLGLCSTTAPGDLSFGGIGAVGAHGTVVPAVNETLSPGHTYGTLSNLILSFTAVVWDVLSYKYVLKDFQRAEYEAKAFLVCLGRTFVTNITVMAGPLQKLRCQSYVNFTATELFSKDPNGKNSFSSFLNKSGRVETILYPLTPCPWLKVWSVQPCKPTESREVHKPYNYAFSDNIPTAVALEAKDAIVTTSNVTSSRTLGLAMYEATVAGLADSFDLWGYSKNVFIYVNYTTLLFHFNGYAVLTRRSNVQIVLHKVYEYYLYLLTYYEKTDNCKNPINGAFEFRVTGLDVPDDVMVPGAKTPAMSSVHPVNGSGYDVAVWLDVGTYLPTPCSCKFLRDFENLLFSTFNRKNIDALVRAEWSKGWGYTSERPWGNKTFINNSILPGFPDYCEFVAIMKKYDPHLMFTNSFTECVFANDTYVCQK